VCVDGKGCVACRPDVDYCDGDTVRRCNTDGTPGDARATCAPGACSAGDCTDACGHAALASSYLGCDYLPTVTANNLLLDAAHFAVAVANPGTADVGVAVSRAGGAAMNVSVAAGQLQTITLPWVTELKNATASALVAGGAYHLTSTAPVTVYQFNPLEFLVTDGCDPNSVGPLGCYTYTNDASLLLPTSTLSRHYIVVARPSFVMQQVDKGLFSSDTSYPVHSPGFVTVVAAEAGATQVQMHFTAPTMAGGPVQAFSAGQTGMFTLNQGDVLQVFSQVPDTCSPNETEDQPGGDFLSSTTFGYCDLPSLDLTGTQIVADKPVAVFSGHNCTFVPYDKWACDHLEEAMLPLEGWGKRYHGVKIVRNPASIPDLFRVVSAVDGNTITFDPPAVHAAMTLGKGAWAEFTATTDFDATGSGPFMLVQFMVGQDFNGYQSGGNNPGDPAMTTAVPVEQYRSSYIFLTPATYNQNYVNVAAPVGIAVTLDGAAIDPAKFTPIGGGGFAGAQLSISAGTHTISASMPFGIQVYGLAPYTSYMYPGGLDIKTINLGIQ
jgi:hypothetical protein